MEGSSSTEIIIIPVEVAKPIPVNTGSNNGSTILNTSRPRTSNSLHNIP